MSSAPVNGDDVDVRPAAVHGTTQVRVVLPSPLCALANVSREVSVPVASPASVQAVVDALEVTYPMLRGTIREHGTGRRRAFVRFFACERDLSHDPPAQPLPTEVVSGREPLLIVGAMAGG